MGSERRFCFFVAVSGKVVENDHGARFDLWDQNLTDVCGEGRAIHGAVDDPWCDQRIVREPCDQSLCAPATKGRIHDQPLSPSRAPAQACEIGLYRRLIYEDNAFGPGCDGGQAMVEPLCSRLSHPGATALGSHQRLFL